MLGAIQIVGLIVGIYVLFRCWELAFQAIGRKDLGGISAGLIITASIITFLIEAALILFLMTYSVDI
jgi:hypothetical protein